jgi:hypothetical protein
MLSDPAMDFQDVLAVLVNWLGREVEVTLAGADGADPTLAAELGGRLARGDELSGRAATADSLMFILEDREGSQVGTFILVESAFRGAGWFDRDGEVLEVRSGVVRLLISTA